MQLAAEGPLCTASWRAVFLVLRTQTSTPFTAVYNYTYLIHVCWGYRVQCTCMYSCTLLFRGVTWPSKSIYQRTDVWFRSGKDDPTFWPECWRLLHGPGGQRDSLSVLLLLPERELGPHSCQWHSPLNPVWPHHTTHTHIISLKHLTYTPIIIISYTNHTHHRLIY